MLRFLAWNQTDNTSGDESVIVSAAVRGASLSHGNNATAQRLCSITWLCYAALVQSLDSYETIVRQSYHHRLRRHCWSGAAAADWAETTAAALWTCWRDGQSGRARSARAVTDAGRSSATPSEALRPLPVRKPSEQCVQDGAAITD